MVLKKISVIPFAPFARILTNTPVNSFISILEAENVVRIREEAFNQELIKLQTELENQKRLQVEQLQKMSEGKSNKTTVTEKCTVQ